MRFYRVKPRSRVMVRRTNSGCPNPTLATLEPYQITGAIVALLRSRPVSSVPGRVPQRLLDSFDQRRWTCFALVEIFKKRSNDVLDRESGIGLQYLTRDSFDVGEIISIGDGYHRSSC
jgi:hypothetical protein